MEYINEFHKLWIERTCSTESNTSEQIRKIKDYKSILL